MEMQILVPRGVMGFGNEPDGYRFVQCQCCARRVWLHKSYHGYGRWCKSCNDGYAGH